MYKVNILKINKLNLRERKQNNKIGFQVKYVLYTCTFKLSENITTICILYKLHVLH